MKQDFQGHPFISGWLVEVENDVTGWSLSCGGGGRGAEARLAAVWDTFYGQ